MSNHEWQADQNHGALVERELREVAERNAKDAQHLRASCIKLEAQLLEARRLLSVQHDALLPFKHSHSLLVLEHGCSMDRIQRLQERVAELSVEIQRVRAEGVELGAHRDPNINSALRDLAREKEKVKRARKALETAASNVDYSECDFRDERASTARFWIEKTQREAVAALKETE